MRYKGEWQTSEAWVHATKLPTVIRVRFLPDKPAINWPADVGVHRSLPLKILFLLASLLGVGYLGARVLSAWYRSNVPWSPAAIALTVSSWALMALAVFEV